MHSVSHHTPDSSNLTTIVIHHAAPCVWSASWLLWIPRVNDIIGKESGTVLNIELKSCNWIVNRSTCGQKRGHFYWQSSYSICSVTVLECTKVFTIESCALNHYIELSIEAHWIAVALEVTHSYARRKESYIWIMVLQLYCLMSHGAILILIKALWLYCPMIVDPVVHTVPGLPVSS